MEIVVDAYDEDERAMGWYNYLEDKLDVPFRPGASRSGRSRRWRWATRSRWSACRRRTSASGRCSSRSAGARAKLAVPLSQLEVIEADDETRQAVEDWHYWVAMGYEF